MRTQYRIRKAAAADLDRILEIEDASFGKDAYDRNLFAYYLNSCGDLFLVAEGPASVGGYMVSCVRRRLTSKRAELVSVAVDPAWRGRGAAAALLESTLRRLRRRGVGRIHLIVRETNAPACELYRKFGFRRLRRMPGYYEDGGDGIAMARAL